MPTTGNKAADRVADALGVTAGIATPIGGEAAIASSASTGLFTVVQNKAGTLWSKVSSAIPDILKSEKGAVRVGSSLDEVMENALINEGKVSIDAIKANPSALSGKSVDEVAQMLRGQGYEVTVQASTKSRSGAQIIKIDNPGESRNITQVQVSPGGGRHRDSPYVKISTNDQGIIKIVDGVEDAYKTDGKETATIIFTGRK